MDQSDNPNHCFFGCVVIVDIYFQEIVLLNLCFVFSKNLISLIEKVTTGAKSLGLFVWNVALAVCDVAWYTTRLAFGSTTLNVLIFLTLYNYLPISSQILFHSYS